MFSISVIEVKGFEMIFRDGKVVLSPKGSNFVGDIIGVRGHGLYQLMGKPIGQGKNQVPKT